MKKWVLSIAGIAIAGGLFAGYRFYKKQIALMKEYDIKPVAVKILKWNNIENLAILEFTVRITNKSAIEATISKLYADLYLNQVYAGFMNNNGKVLIPAKGSADAKMQITFAPKQIFKNIISTIAVLLATKDVPYQLKGYVKIKSSFVGVSLPFDEKGNLKNDLL